MGAVLYLIAFLAYGSVSIRLLLPGFRPLRRLWLGSCLGLLEMMWLPALFAFRMNFTLQAHYAALGAGALLTGVCFAVRDRRPARGWDAEETRRLKELLLIAVPLTVLSAWLQYTHVLRPDPNGNLNVGQSTYGDLPMHLSFISGMKNASFPPEYPFYPGTRLSYPFLADSLSTGFLLLGCSLRMATILPAVLMMALCFWGVLELAGRMTGCGKAALLAVLLFFLNGGLGFLYDFDQAGGLEADGTLTVWSRIRAILTGYYQTPTNKPEPDNLRWSNVIADLMVPQRTLLGGWCMVLPCFDLLLSLGRAERIRGNPEAWGDNRKELRLTLLLGIWAGSLPLIHTHSFLALFLVSFGWMTWDLIHRKGERFQVFLRYLLYGVTAAALSLPQLILFTFSQVTGSASFLCFQFNWVNNPGGNGMRDLYLWFYVKNIGLPFVILIFSLFERNRRGRRAFFGALPVILAAELIRFQPNEYDNNKLLYLAWLLCCMPVADWCAGMWRRLKGMRARPVIAAAAAVVFFLSAGLSLWRECVSSYQAFSAQAVEVSNFALEETTEDSVFLTGTQHLNPVSSLAGRRTVCGPDLWLYWHGFDTSERKTDIRRFYEDPEHNLDVLAKYGADYIMVSSYERNDYEADIPALDRNWERVFENGEAVIWRIPEG